MEIINTIFPPKQDTDRRVDVLPTPKAEVHIITIFCFPLLHSYHAKLLLISQEILGSIWDRTEMWRKNFTCPDLFARAARLSVRYWHATHLDSQKALEMHMVFQMFLYTNTYPTTLEMPCLDACENIICFFFVDTSHLQFTVVLQLNKNNQLLLFFSPAVKSSQLILNFLILHA